MKYKIRIETKNHRTIIINKLIDANNDKKAMENFGKYLLHYIPNARCFYKDWISTEDNQIYFLSLIKVIGGM